MNIIEKQRIAIENASLPLESILKISDKEIRDMSLTERRKALARLRVKEHKKEVSKSVL